MSSPQPIEIEGIRYALCEQDDLAEMASLLAETFTRHDPPAVAVGLTADEFEHFVRIVSKEAAEERLTVIARDAVGGAMVGAQLAEDATKPPPADLDTLSTKFDAIFELFGLLDDRASSDGPMEPGQAVHLFLIGVDERFARRGIAQQLVKQCLNNAAERGYRRAVAEATNLVSQHIFDKLGFASRAQVLYADYRRDGESTFASIVHHGGPRAMALDIVPRQVSTDESG